MPQKMHFMEAHVSNWLEKWNVGLGFMGEQGDESIHASFNNIERLKLRGCSG